jgi:hypothetical protein
MKQPTLATEPTVVYEFEEEQINASYTDGQQSHDRTSCHCNRARPCSKSQGRAVLSLSCMNRRCIYVSWFCLMYLVVARHLCLYFVLRTGVLSCRPPYGMRAQPNVPVSKTGHTPPARLIRGGCGQLWHCMHTCRWAYQHIYYLQEHRVPKRSLTLRATQHRKGLKMWQSSHLRKPLE